MKVITFFFLFVTSSMLSLSTFAQIGGDVKLPETWAKDFIIMLSYHSSMSGTKTTVKFTFDSCTYQSVSNLKMRKRDNKLHVYKLKAADRIAILKKLQELKVDKIKSEHGVHAVHDGWSQSICFGFNCIEGGTSAEMSEDDKNQFLTAYRFLEEFAIKKAK